MKRLQNRALDERINKFLSRKFAEFPEIAPFVEATPEETPHFLRHRLTRHLQARA